MALTLSDAKTKWPEGISRDLDDPGLIGQLEEQIKASLEHPVAADVRHQVDRLLRRSIDDAFSITFAHDLSPSQIKQALQALADYYRSCGGVGLATKFELEEVEIREPVHA